MWRSRIVVGCGDRTFKSGVLNTWLPEIHGIAIEQG